ncbi:MAG: MFS transporter [Thermodesulfobacteriota bacterium]
MTQPTAPPRIFYGWYIVAASFTILFFCTGARYAFGVMFKPIIQEFGWSRGAISLVFFVNMVVFALGLMVVGKIYDRYGPKWVIMVSSLLISSGFAMTSVIHSIGEFFFSYGILAALGVAGTAAPLMATLTSKWFDRLRGLAISLSMSGVSIGQFVLVPFFSLLTGSYGWRASYLYMGIIMLVVNVLLAAFVIRGDPHHLGLKPLGWKEKAVTEAPGKDRSPPAGHQEDFGLRQAMRTPSYWFFAVAMFICGGGDYFATTHLIPLATDLGISAQTAGNMLGWYGLMSLAGILMAGPAADRIGSKVPMAITFLLRVFLWVMILKYKSVSSLYGFALLFGFTHLVTAALIPMLTLRLYGSTHLGILTGFINTVHFLGGGVWAYAAGVLFDLTGSYQLAFLVSAVAAGVATVCSLLIVERRHRVPARVPPSGEDLSS